LHAIYPKNILPIRGFASKVGAFMFTFATSSSGLNHFFNSVFRLSCWQDKVAESKVEEEEEESRVVSPLPKVEMLPPETADKRSVKFSVPVCTLV